MKIIYAKFLFFLIEYTYFSLSAASWNPKDIVKNITKNVKNDCIFGVKSVQLILYNNEFPYGEEIGLQEVCNIDPLKRIIFFVHGFTSSPNNTDIYNFSVECLKKNYTMFSVDWSQAACKKGTTFSQLLEYPFAVKNTREVGAHMADYISALMTKCKVPKDNILLIGHSLGAHVCGFAAKKIQAEHNITMPRIIGADPAAPLFVFNNCNERLCKKDAENVYVCHTSFFGLPYSVGHYDFYFNGSKTQPGCDSSDVFCSHNKSVVYLTLMMKYVDCGFPSISKTLCLKSDPETTDWISLDSRIYDKDYIEKGEYNVFVNSEYPYCIKNTLSCNKK